MLDWLINQTPNPVLIDLNFVKIYWYGLLVSFGIILGLALTYRLYIRYKFERDSFWDLSFYVIAFAFLGDRLTHVLLYEWDYYSQNLLDIFKVWKGGLAIHGAIFVGLLVIYIFARQKKISFYKLADVFVPAIALGLAIGRWGNYFNQEIYGLPTSSWFSIPIDLAHRVSGFEIYEKFIPIFFYASLMNLVIFLGLLVLHYIKLKTNKIKDGVIMICFLFTYGISRFIIEFWRIDSQNNFLNLRTGQWLSLLMIVLAGGLVWKVLDRER